MSQVASENQPTASHEDIELDSIHECERDDPIQSDSEAEIHAELHAMMNELGVSSKAQQQFMAHSSVPKSLLLNEWSKTREMIGQSDAKQVGHFCGLLQQRKVAVEALERLRVYVWKNRWLRGFLDAGGVGHIAGVIDRIFARQNKNGQAWNLFVSTVKCLNELAKTADGAQALVDAAAMVQRITKAILKHQSAFEANAAVSSSTRVDSVFAKTATQAPVLARIAVFKLLRTLCAYGGERGQMTVVRSLNEENESGCVNTTTQEQILQDFRNPTLQSWMTEFECVVDECVQHWGGARDKTARIFSHLADGTYRWQPIVYAKTHVFPIAEATEYLLCHLSLLDALLHSRSSKTAFVCMDFTLLLRETRVFKILQKLQSSPHIKIKNLAQNLQRVQRDTGDVAPLDALLPRKVLRKCPRVQFGSKESNSSYEPNLLKSEPRIRS
ncbi:hypothetical protein HDU77_005950 [Chytriomyces hyalinus]|nr:hypothetical protein HDU77_005950 [Chytriomyces hyalinus]